jgi:hypothetical protein
VRRRSGVEPRRSAAVTSPSFTSHPWLQLRQHQRSRISLPVTVVSSATAPEMRQAGQESGTRSPWRLLGTQLYNQQSRSRSTLPSRETAGFCGAGTSCDCDRDMTRFLKWTTAIAAIGVAGVFAMRAVQTARRKVKSALGEAEAVADRTREALAETETALRSVRQSI